MTLYVTSSYAAPRVVLVVHPSEFQTSDPRVVAWQQLRAELEADGFDVVTAADTDVSSSEILEASARRTQSFAAVRVVRTDEGLAADVWIENPSTGRTVVHRVRASGRITEAARTLALRATELLGASLLVLSVTTEELEETGRSLRVWIGAAVLGHPGGLSTAAGPALGFAWQFTSSVLAELRLVMPIQGEEFAAAGTAETDQQVALASLRLEPPRQGAVFAFAAAGCGAYRLGAEGRAVGPLVGRADDEIVAAVSLGIGFGMRVLRSAHFDVSAVFRGDALSLMPRPVLRLAEASAHKAGQPALVASGGLEVAW
jgi:hypothetical protein